MSWYDYKRSIELSDAPFYALIMAAMRRADTWNLAILKNMYPDIWHELQNRDHAPGGYLEGETQSPDK